MLEIQVCSLLKCCAAIQVADSQDTKGTMLDPPEGTLGAADSNSNKKAGQPTGAARKQ